MEKDHIYSSTSLKKRWRWVGAWSIVILLLSVAPAFLMPANKENVLWEFSLDKIGHFAVYAILAGLICWTSDRSKMHRFVFGVALAALYGFVMEVLQLCLASGRHFEIDDLIANIIGSLSGSLLTILFIVKNNNV